MAEINSKDLKEFVDTLKDLTGDESGGAAELVENIVKLLALPDDKFEVLAPGILQSYQQTVNNPNDKIALAQSFNAAGIRAEDLTEAYTTILDEIDQTSLTAQKRDFLKELIMTLINAVNDTEGIAKRNVPVAIELCHPDAKIPQYAHITDSGADIYALDDVTVHPGETILVPTGFKVALPPGFELQVRPKSGRAVKTKLRVANTPGTIDQGYRDEVKVIIENIEPPIKDITINDDGMVTSVLYGGNFTIGKGEKFAQLVLAEVPKASFYRVDKVSDIGEDRGGGFGSTGVK